MGCCGHLMPPACRCRNMEMMASSFFLFWRLSQLGAWTSAEIIHEGPNPLPRACAARACANHWMDEPLFSGPGYGAYTPRLANPRACRPMPSGPLEAVTAGWQQTRAEERSWVGLRSGLMARGNVSRAAKVKTGLHWRMQDICYGGAWRDEPSCDLQLICKAPGGIRASCG